MTVARATALLFFLANLPAQDMDPVPVKVEASVDTARLTTAGRADLELRFVCDAVLDRPFALRVELYDGDRLMQRRDHAPPVPTRDWLPDSPVSYALPLFFPLETSVRGEIEVRLGFLDPSTNKVAPPQQGRASRTGLVVVARFAMPPLPTDLDETAVALTIASATALAKEQPQAAWDQLEFAFRRTDDYGLKRKLQKALLSVGKTNPAPLSFEEKDIVAGRIRAERARYLREVAGRLFDRGMLHGALLLLDEVGGELKEQADRAVLGALGDAKRDTQRRESIVEKLFELTDEQNKAVQALVEKHQDTSKRLKVALDLAEDPATRGVACDLLRTLRFDTALRDQAEEARLAIEKAWLADVPADQREQAEAAMNHPCWARTRRRESHRFVMIGPERLLAGIDDESLLRFDIAYLYLTDLFGRVPNPDGDRVTVYFKELWRFGGGVGGGKIIDIGNADPDKKKLRVDGGLFYHELTHCIDDTNPVYGGMREGLADFGAAFAYQELGQVAAARGAFGIAQRAFLGDYLERDLEYWRIPNYGPSAGLLLHFMQKYGKDKDGYHWERYRKFFRDYRRNPVKDARAPAVARAFAFCLVEAFGEGAFADLQEFRWPLLDTDLDAIRREQQAVGDARAAAALADELGHPSRATAWHRVCVARMRGRTIITKSSVSSPTGG